MNNKLRFTDKIQKFSRYLNELGFVTKKSGGKTMHLQSAFITLTFRIQVIMKMFTRKLPVTKFYCCNFYNAMTQFMLQTGRFRIQYDLTHFKILENS